MSRFAKTSWILSRSSVRARMAGLRRRAFFDWRYVPIESRRAYRMACVLFLSVLMYFVFQRHVVSLSVIEDRSMLPTLSEGEYFLVNKYIYYLSRPKRGDVVALRYMPGMDAWYVKRVIGLAGETLLIRGGQVYLNGTRLQEPYAVGPTWPDMGLIVIAEGHCFLMGDNRLASVDSRAFGAVPVSAIEGKLAPGQLFPFW